MTGSLGRTVVGPASAGLLLQRWSSTETIDLEAEILAMTIPYGLTIPYYTPNPVLNPVLLM